MSSVFECSPYATSPRTNPAAVRRQLVSAFAADKWLSTGELYKLTNRVVKRDLLHVVLKSMLNDRTIRMRIIPVAGARDRTEFKRNQCPE